MKIDDVIAAACEELNCSYETNALWFEVLINQAIRSHKTVKKYRQKHLRLEAQDNKIILPSGWFRLDYIYQYGTQIKLCPDIDYQVQDDCVMFDTSLKIADGTKFDVWLWMLNTDSNDELVIPNDWERMLVAYIGWKFTRRNIKDSGVAVMQNYQREYQTQKLGNV
jgi:hypothetical protein